MMKSQVTGMKKNKTSFKWKMRTGDQVVVIAGANKGKKGELLRVDRSKGRVFVKGVAIVTRHQKASQDNPEGSRVRKEASVHMSNVMLLDPETNKPSRVGIRFDEKRNVRLLIAKKSGKELRAV